jgi:hypothetical protein
VLFLQNMSIKYTMMMMVMSRSSKVWATSPRRHRPCLICHHTRDINSLNRWVAASQILRTAFMGIPF